MRLAVPALLACFALTACPRPAARGVAPASTAHVGPALPTQLANDAGVVERSASLAEVARDVYAAISEGRFSDARRRLEGHDDANHRCWGGAHVTTLPDGGALVSGPHALVVTNASGDIVSHEVVADCLRFADGKLRILASDTAFRIVEGDSSADLPRDEGSSPNPEQIFVSDAWALVDFAGEWIALNRRTGDFIRAHHAEEGAVTVAGDWLVAGGDKGISMRRADGRVVDVRGCSGKLLAAVGADRGEQALHVQPAADGTDTRVCLVRADGTTRKIAALGSATCGLAQAMPCPFVLQASTRRLLGFGSMRGQIVFVDTVVGRRLPAPLPPRDYFDGLSPGGVTSCDEDELCMFYTRASDGGVGASSVTMPGDKLVARVLVKRADHHRASWCTLAGLPVPSAVCEEQGTR